MERNKRRRLWLWDSAEYWYTIKNIMLSNEHSDFFFMYDTMHSDNISLGEYLDAYDFFDRNKPRTLRKVVSDSKSIRSVCISNKKCIHDTSSSIHKLSDFK